MTTRNRPLLSPQGGHGVGIVGVGHDKAGVPGHQVGKGPEGLFQAAASCISLGVEASAVEKGLAAFRGAGRRFEKKGSCNGAARKDFSTS